MKFNIWLLCGAVVACQVYAADDIYLEGISSLGKQRVAYVLVNETKFSLKEGERLTGWKVTKIGQRSVILADAKGSETELMLHNRMSPESASPELVEKTEKNVQPTPAEKKVTEDAPAPPNEDVPKGYRKVKTPFGEVIVQEDVAKPAQEIPATAPAAPPQNSMTPPPAPTKEPTKEEEVRPGYHKVRTPFGEIWIEDKKQLPSSTEKEEKTPSAAMK